MVISHGRIQRCVRKGSRLSEESAACGCLKRGLPASPRARRNTPCKKPGHFSCSGFCRLRRRHWIDSLRPPIRTASSGEERKRRRYSPAIRTACFHPATGRQRVRKSAGAGELPLANLDCNIAQRKRYVKYFLYFGFYSVINNLSTLSRLPCKNQFRVAYRQSFASVVLSPAFLSNSFAPCSDKR